MNNAMVLALLAGTFATDGAPSKLIRDRTGNIAAADTPRFAAANIVHTLTLNQNHYSSSAESCRIL